MLYTFLIIVDTLLAISVVVLILLNRGRGAEVGAAFGGGSAASSVFGSKGAAPFITKVIAVLSGLFLINSLGLAYLVNSQYIQGSVVDKIDVEELQPLREQPGESVDMPEAGGADSTQDFENAGDDMPPAVPN